MSSIPILNPAPHGSRYASVQSANRLIRKGRAVWSDAHKTAIRITAPHEFSQPDSSNGLTYDRIHRVMTRDELRALPFVGNVDRLMAGRVKRVLPGD